MAAGEADDVRNYNFPVKRKEFKWRQADLKEIPSYLAYDLSHMLSLQPWKAFYHQVKQFFSPIPQPYQSDLGGQLCLATSMLVLIAYLPMLKHCSARLLKVVGLLSAISAIFKTMPLLVRSWNCRDQKDGKLGLIGMPIFMVTQLFFFSKRFLYVSGLNFVSGIFMNKGLQMNSEKNNTFCTLLDNLAGLAAKNPKLQASDILNYLEQPDLQAKWCQKIGLSRLTKLKNQLYEAALLQFQGIPLAETIRNKPLESGEAWEELPLSQSTENYRTHGKRLCLKC